MFILVQVLAAVACIAAEPILYNYDLPYLYNYRYGYDPIIKPFVRGVVPHVHPVGYSYPYHFGLKSLYQERDFLGQARYGHVEPGQSHYAVQDVFGNKVGGFSYYNAEGKLKQTSYIADGAGYRVSSNDLPIDTPEVLAAKAAHFAEHEKIKGRSKRDVLLPASVSKIVPSIPYIDYRIAAPIPHAFPTTLTVPVVKPDGFLADTPEVVAAKSLHFAEWEAARARTFSPIKSISPFVPFDYRYKYPLLF